MNNSKDSGLVMRTFKITPEKKTPSVINKDQKLTNYTVRNRLKQHILYKLLLFLKIKINRFQ